MSLLTEAFFVVVAQSARIGLLIFVWAALRIVLRGRIPQQILFVGWFIIALGLLIPVSLPVAWSPFNFVRPAHWVPAAGLRMDGLPTPTQSMMATVAPPASALMTPATVRLNIG